MLRAGRWTLLLLALSLVVSRVPAEERKIAVIVHKDNQQDKIDLRELKKIFMLEQQHWSDEGKIRVYIQKSETFEQQIALESIYHMSDTELQKLWTEKLADNLRKPPASSTVAIKRAVARDPRAIGFIDSEAQDDTVKVLRIDGKTPEAPAYPLSKNLP